MTARMLVNGVTTEQISTRDRGFGYGDGLFESHRVRAHIGGCHHDFGRRDVRKLRNRELDHRHETENRHDDRDDHRDDRAVDEEFRHAASCVC